MTNNNFRIDSVGLQNLLRTFNINRSDIKELWSNGVFGTIAVPADRYKQYYDAIETQAQRIAELEGALREITAGINIEAGGINIVQLDYKISNEPFAAVPLSVLIEAKKALGEEK